MNSIKLESVSSKAKLSFITFFLQIVTAEKKGMALEIEDLKAEIKQMEAELKAVQKTHRYIKGIKLCSEITALYDCA